MLDWFASYLSKRTLVRLKTKAANPIAASFDFTDLTEVLFHGLPEEGKPPVDPPCKPLILRRLEVIRRFS